jgi:hypothetical protein
VLDEVVADPVFGEVDSFLADDEVASEDVDIGFDDILLRQAKPWHG